MQDIDARRLGEDELRGEVAELEQVAGIRAALADGRLRIDEQEIVEVATRRVVLHELLVRMVRSDGTVVAPDDFLPLAERHGVIEEIDRWVLQQAVDLAAAGQAVAVNVSARTMSDPAYRGVALALLADRESTAGRLTFEITETAVVEDFEHASGFARQMRDLGCGVALDDFGTGFGALTYIKKLPAQFLKIDREFVTDLTTDPRSRAVVSGVVTLAKSFGQRTIAEGVEDAETFELLRELGVDFAQGYYLARPVWSAGAGRQA
jgi:EAL domain-containing protein (putative c-di-GMP-specific phosphodiesterase class I)